ncbi:MAG: hypothetical protein ABI481_02375 [Pyrinomonadaceae bacterium]
MANRSAPKRKLITLSESAVLLIDVITNFEFEGGGELLRRLQISQDCIAAVKPALTKQAMEFIERVSKADTRNSEEISFRHTGRR